jgi:hypothetical protein
MNTVLGGSMSSRLFQNVREKRGLVYSISSGGTSYSDAGVLTVYAGTSLDSVDQVVRLTIEEFRRMKGDKLPPEELRRAKDHLKGSLMLSLENTGSRMSHPRPPGDLLREAVLARRDHRRDRSGGRTTTSAGSPTRSFPAASGSASSATSGAIALGRTSCVSDTRVRRVAHLERGGEPRGGGGPPARGGAGRAGAGGRRCQHRRHRADRG